MQARIFLMDSNAADLTRMACLLQAAGYTSLVAGTGGDALVAFRQERPDLVLCDPDMQSASGLEMASRLRSDAVLRGIRLVAVTAAGELGDREKILAAGFDGYIAKPINANTFVRHVEALLPARQRVGLAAGTTAKNADPSASVKGKTILVVDSQPAEVDHLRGLLQHHGYRVVTAGGTRGALTLAGQVRCDLILSDIEMSEGTGFELIRAVKANPALRGIPFLFMTSPTRG